MIKVLHNFQYDAPELSGSQDSLIPLLDKVLLDGYNDQLVTQITSSGLTATVTIDSGHNMSNGDVVKIYGAVQDGYNGEFKISNCSVDTFDYTLESGLVSPATGTIRCKIAPLNWDYGLEGNHKKVYIPNSEHQFLYRVNEVPLGSIHDSYGGSFRHARFDLFESMTDIETGYPDNNPFDLFIMKSKSLTTSWRPWIIVGTDKQFYLFTSPGTNQAGVFAYRPNFLGQFNSYKVDDQYNFAILASYADLVNGIQTYIQYNSTSLERCNMQLLYGLHNNIGNKSGGVIARNYLGQPLFCSAEISDGGDDSTASWSYNIGNLNLVDNSIYYRDVYIFEQGVVRGIMPGLYHVLQKIEISPTTGFEVFTGPEINGIVREMIHIYGSDYYEFILDITGPWE